MALQEHPAPAVLESMILFVDEREPSHEKISEICSREGVKVVVRELPVADFLWGIDQGTEVILLLQNISYLLFRQPSPISLFSCRKESVTLSGFDLTLSGRAEDLG